MNPREHTFEPTQRLINGCALCGQLRAAHLRYDYSREALRAMEQNLQFMADMPDALEPSDYRPTWRDKIVMRWYYWRELLGEWIAGRKFDE